jgi:hypothetical protein
LGARVRAALLYELHHLRGHDPAFALRTVLKRLSAKKRKENKVSD